MIVFVAGGTGAVGRLMVPLLAAAGHTVHVLTRRPELVGQLEAAGAHGVVGDVFDAPALTALMADRRPDAVIHQLTDLPQSFDPRHIDEIYARNNRVRREGTRHLLDASRAAGVQRFVVQSMATWYAPEGGPIKTETDPLWTDAPEPLGAAVRTLAEMEAAVLNESPQPVVLRYGGFYGPGTWYAKDAEIAARMRRRMMPMIGDGSGITSFVHIEDAASAAVAALAAPPGVYNIVDGHPARASEWMPAFADAVGAPHPMRAPEFLARLALGSALTAWMSTMRGASNAKALASLDWRPRYDDWRDGFRHL